RAATGILPPQSRTSGCLSFSAPSGPTEKKKARRSAFTSPLAASAKCAASRLASSRIELLRRELHMANRFTVVILLGGLCALAGGGHAQDGPKEKRTLYVPKHGQAKELATILAKHFKGDAEIQVLPDSPSNCLLVRAAPSVLEEVVKLLEQLDRRP